MTKERKEELRELINSNKFWSTDIGDLQNIIEECLDAIDLLQGEFSKYAGFLYAHGFFRSSDGQNSGEKLYSSQKEPEKILNNSSPATFTTIIKGGLK